MSLSLWKCLLLITSLILIFVYLQIYIDSEFKFVEVFLLYITSLIPIFVYLQIYIDNEFKLVEVGPI